MSVALRERRLCVKNDVLHLILMPTEACNFRCTYCYEEFQRARMRANVVHGVKKLVQRRIPRLRKLAISWFGGEPLLAFDIIEDVMSRISSLRERYPGVALDGQMTTNAFMLDRSRFERLLMLGVTRYQITFDGPREVHDRVRKCADGSGSFDRVWENVIAMRDVPNSFEITVRLHVDWENLRDVPRFIRAYARCFRGDPRFRLYLRRRSRLGGPNDPQLQVFERKEADRVITRLNGLVARRGLAHAQRKDFTRVCYAARGSSLVVRADGRLNKCTVVLEHPNNQVGRIDADGRIDVKSERMVEWMRGFWSGEEEHMRCPMRGYADIPPAVQGRGGRSKKTDAEDVVRAG